MTPKTEERNLLIGIDPDIDKSGIAIKNLTDKTIELKTLTFFEFFDFLNLNGDKINLVRVEAAWLIEKSNWHTHNSGQKGAERIAKNTGSNHEAGRKIVEMLKYLKVPHLEVRPLKKCWKGTNGKISHDEIVKLVKGLPKKTNQEQRDALLLIL